MPHWFAFGFDTPPRIDVPELIDDSEQPYTDFRASMSDVRRANRYLGGTVVVTRQARNWLQTVQQEQQASRQDHAPPAAPLIFLDVATGSGDIPQALSALAHKAGVPLQIIGLDYSVPILRYAREEVGASPEIRLLRGDAFHLPLADNSVDYALCSLAFHHWRFALCVEAMREMERVARRGWLVNDLRRAWSAWGLIRLVMQFARVNRLTRHDAPASVLRAYSLAEYEAMPQALGLAVGRDVHVRRSLFYRVALIRNK